MKRLTVSVVMSFALLASLIGSGQAGVRADGSGGLSAFAVWWHPQGDTGSIRVIFATHEATTGIPPRTSVVVAQGRCLVHKAKPRGCTLQVMKKDIATMQFQVDPTLRNAHLEYGSGNRQTVLDWSGHELKDPRFDHSLLFPDLESEQMSVGAWGFATASREASAWGRLAGYRLKEKFLYTASVSASSGIGTMACVRKLFDCA